MFSFFFQKMHFSGVVSFFSHFQRFSHLFAFSYFHVFTIFDVQMSLFAGVLSRGSRLCGESGDWFSSLWLIGFSSLWFTIGF